MLRHATIKNVLLNLQIIAILKLVLPKSYYSLKIK